MVDHRKLSTFLSLPKYFANCSALKNCTLQHNCTFISIFINYSALVIFVYFLPNIFTVDWHVCPLFSGYLTCCPCIFASLLFPFIWSVQIAEHIFSYFCIYFSKTKSREKKWIIKVKLRLKWWVNKVRGKTLWQTLKRRPKYAQAIFRVCSWLKIIYCIGPQRAVSMVSVLRLAFN